jgi:single-strand DNA-binding protein
MNTVFFTGNIGNDAETRTVGQSEVCNFNVAVRQGQSRDAKSEWYRCAIWGQRGSQLKSYLTKGAKVAVVGELEIGEYNGKPQFNVRVADIDPFCGGKRDEQKSDQRREPDGSRGAPQQAFDRDLDDDVPFVSSDFAIERRVG